ncbi:MAG: tRNA pseudouridine(55) synthase TruB [Gemmatimonadota bacterium]
MGRIPAEGGVMLVDKSAGPTSHDVVSSARRALGIRRVGHTGTLDPFATGLLLLCVGLATRLAEYFHLLPKSYVASLRLGVETTTHDGTGRPVSSSGSWRGLARERVQQVLSTFLGELSQRPPAYSAKRIEGRRAHALAREGDRPELEPVGVRIHALDLVEFEPPHLRLAARVSTGTYVRALARDIGHALGCGAHLTELRRTAIGSFRADQGVPVGEIRPPAAAESWWCTPAESLDWLPARELSEQEVRRVRFGAAVGEGTLEPGRSPQPDVECAPTDVPLVLLRKGRLVAVARRDGGLLMPKKVFASPVGAE